MSGLSLKTPFTIYNDGWVYTNPPSKIMEKIFSGQSELEDFSTHNNSIKLENWIPEAIDDKLGSFNDEYIIAIEMSENKSDNYELKIKGWFNAQAYHSLPAAVLYADKLMLGTGIKLSYKYIEESPMQHMLCSSQHICSQGLKNKLLSV